jgi:hypothetical protein
MGWGARTAPRTHLIVASLDPLLIKAMTPKVTLAIIRSVWFPAVGAPGDMRAWGTLRGRGNRGGSLGVTLAASHEDPMVVLVVWA